MDLLDKVEEIAMTSLLVLYNTNPMPFAICVPFPPTNAKQQRLGGEEKLQEQEISVAARRKKTKKKLVRGVIIRKISTRTSSDPMSTPRNSQSCVTRKKRMKNNEHPSNDISTQLEISFAEPSQMTIVARENNVEDLNDDDIGIEMNEQLPFKNLSPLKMRLNYD